MLRLTKREGRDESHQAPVGIRRRRGARRDPRCGILPPALSNLAHILLSRPLILSQRCDFASVFHHHTLSESQTCSMSTLSEDNVTGPALISPEQVQAVFDAYYRGEGKDPVQVSTFTGSARKGFR